MTTDPERAPRVFDWARCGSTGECDRSGDGRPARPRADRVPRAGGGERAGAPDRDGRRGPDGAADLPGHACPSNALVGEILDRSDEELLFITSANTSSNVTQQVEAAHYEMGAIRGSSGTPRGRADRAPQRARAPARCTRAHLPCSTSIIAFHRGELVLERHGSLSIEHAKVIAAKRGLRLAVESDERLPGAVAARGCANVRRLRAFLLRFRRRVDVRGRVHVARGVRISVAPDERVILEAGCLLGAGCRIEAAAARSDRRGRAARRAQRDRRGRGRRVGAGAVVGEWAVLSDAEPAGADRGPRR